MLCNNQNVKQRTCKHAVSRVSCSVLSHTGSLNGSLLSRPSSTARISFPNRTTSSTSLFVIVFSSLRNSKKVSEWSFPSTGKTSQIFYRASQLPSKRTKVSECYFFSIRKSARTLSCTSLSSRKASQTPVRRFCCLPTTPRTSYTDSYTKRRKKPFPCPTIPPTKKSSKPSVKQR